MPITTLARMYFVWSIPLDPCFVFAAIGIIILIGAYFIRNLFRRKGD